MESADSMSAGCMAHELVFAESETAPTRVSCSCGYIIGYFPAFYLHAAMYLIHWKHKIHQIDLLERMWQGAVSRDSHVFQANRKG